MCATWPAYLVFLYLIILIIFYKGYESCNFQNTNYSPVCFYFLPLGSSHFPRHHQFTSLHYTETKLHTHTKQQTDIPSAQYSMSMCYHTFRTFQNLPIRWELVCVTQDGVRNMAALQSDTDLSPDRSLPKKIGTSSCLTEWKRRVTGRRYTS